MRTSADSTLRSERLLPLKVALGARLVRDTYDQPGGIVIDGRMTFRSSNLTLRELRLVVGKTIRRKRSPSSQERWRRVQKSLHCHLGKPGTADGRDHNRPVKPSTSDAQELREKIRLRAVVRNRDVEPRKHLTATGLVKPGGAKARERRAELRLAYRSLQVVAAPPREEWIQVSPGSFVPACPTCGGPAPFSKCDPCSRRPREAFRIRDARNWGSAIDSVRGEYHVTRPGRGPVRQRRGRR
jgi:hypothetical protein